MRNKLHGEQREIHYRVFREARLNPEAIAVRQGHETWTYREIESASCMVARALRAEGVAPGEVIVLETGRCASLVIFMLAAMTAGAVFLVAREKEPAAYVRRMLVQIPRFHYLTNNSGEVSRSLIASRFGKEIGGFLAFSRKELKASCSQPRESNATYDGQAANAGMYLIPTSGSTGQPKLVLGSHEPLQHFIDWYWKEFGFDRNTGFTLLSGIGYDPMFRDIFVPLCNGACVFIPEAADFEGRESLLAWIQRNRCAVAHLTPTLAAWLFAEGGEAILGDLRVIGCGGGVLLRKSARDIMSAAPNATLLNFYGTTETPQVMTFRVVTERDLQHGDMASESLPIGGPIAGVKVGIYREDGALCATGEAGQIVVATRYLSKGYYGDADATRIAFQFDRDNPDNSRYATGDYGYMDEIGTIMYRGRRDRQVKVGGYRIQIEEIERALAEHESVSNAGIVALTGPDGAVRLHCFVSIGLGCTTTATELRLFLLQRLPPHMIPDEFVLVAALPQTGNGKIDYSTLERQAHDRQRFRASGFALTSSAEATVLKIWARVLQIDVSQLSSSTNFFESGGTSLLGARLVKALEREFGRPVSITDLFLYPNPKGLAQLVTGGASLDGKQRFGMNGGSSRDERLKQIARRRISKLREYS